jgi:hypothetical protein
MKVPNIKYHGYLSAVIHEDRTDRRTELTKPLGEFRYNAKVPNEKHTGGTALSQRRAATGPSEILVLTRKYNMQYCVLLRTAKLHFF